MWTLVQSCSGYGRLQLRLQAGTVITIIWLVSISVTIKSNHRLVTTAAGKFRQKCEILEDCSKMMYLILTLYSRLYSMQSLPWGGDLNQQCSIDSTQGIAQGEASMLQLPGYWCVTQSRWWLWKHSRIQLEIAVCNNFKFETSIDSRVLYTPPPIPIRFQSEYVESTECPRIPMMWSRVVWMNNQTKQTLG